MNETPSIAHSAVAVGRLHLLRLFRGKRLIMAAVAVALVDVAIISAGLLVPELEPALVFEKGVRFGYFSLLVFLVPFLLMTGLIAEEIEARTLPFLLVRPVSRTSLALGKAVTAAGVAAAFLVIGILVLHVGVFVTSPELFVDSFPGTLRITGALLLLGFLYGSVCAFWGALFPQGGSVVAALFLGFVEFFGSRLPSSVRFVSSNHWGQELAGLERGGFLPDTVPEVELWIAALPITGELALFTAGLLLVVSFSEFRFGKA